MAEAAGARPIRSTGVPPRQGHAAPREDTQAKLPEGLKLADWLEIRAEYESRRHGMLADGEGGYQSRAHRHGWLARFDGNGFAVKPDGERWSWGLELERWGRPGEEMAAGSPARMEKDGNRLTYRRKGMTEWFVNGEEGLRHGFTIGECPQGASGELSLYLRVRGDLALEADSSERGVVCRTRQGDEALHYRKLVVMDARGRLLAARLSPKGELLRIVTDDRPAVYPITVGIIAQQESESAANPVGLDFFGSPVAICGDTVVVGAGGETSSVVRSGAAYVFVHSAGRWSQQAQLQASNPGENDGFGYSVAICGDTVVVGASGEDSNATGVDGDGANHCARGAGAAYVFVRNSGRWSQQAYLKASNTGWGDCFGSSVAISGDTVVVGAVGEDSNATGVNGDGSNDFAPNSGAAYVFVRRAGRWSQEAYLKASNAGPDDHFGWSVAICGATLVVGAAREASGAGGINGDGGNDAAAYSGAAYVFVRSAGSWRQETYLKASNPGLDDHFGWSVAISGDAVVVGAPYRVSGDSGVNGGGRRYSAANSGAAYVFVRRSGRWSQEAYLKASNAGPDDYFGWSVAISGDTVVVGATRGANYARGVTAPYCGAAYLFARSSGIWSQQAILKTSNTEPQDDCGFSVAISGDTVVMGAAGEESGAGRVNEEPSNLMFTKWGAGPDQSVQGVGPGPQLRTSAPGSGGFQ